MNEDIDEIIKELRQENPGKPEESFVNFKQKIIDAVETGKSHYDNDKSSEYNIAYIGDALQMSGYDFGDYHFDVTMLVIKYV